MDNLNPHFTNTSIPLRAAVSAAWNEGLAELQACHNDSNPISVQSISDGLREIFFDRLTSLLEAHNRLQRATSLPVELISQVFACVSNVKQRADLALVCRAWRDALVNSPGAWRTVVFNWQSRLDALPKMLELSRQAPLHLSIDYNRENQDTVLEWLPTTLSRCISLNLELMEEQGDLADFGLLAKALTHAAPLLITFVLIDHMGYLEPLEFEEADLFAMVAPRLVQLVTQSRLATLLCPGASALRGVQQLLFAPSAAIGRRDLSNLLECIPNVQHLQLDLDHWVSPPVEDRGLESSEGADRSTSTRITVPTSLRLLVLVVNKNDSAILPVFNALHHLSVRQVWLIWRRRESSPNDPLMLRALLGGKSLIEVMVDKEQTPRFEVRGMSLESTYYPKDSLNVRMYGRPDEPYEAAPLNRAHSPKPATDPLPGREVLEIGNEIRFEHWMFTQLVRLDLTETMFFPSKLCYALPDLPVLRDLTVFAMRTRTHATATQSAFIDVCHQSPSEEHHILRCPALSSLRFASRVPLSRLLLRTCLTPEVIVGFGSRFLQYGAAKLDKLIMQGIDMHVINPSDFQRLLNLAHETLWDERSLGQIYATDELLQWPSSDA
ncbi:hypothetical protein BKA62DRAFT_829188 [Auriculariales sp. MPI-PUGE-AT-0066]|nr:hypothetical protein BKA62DRAFT_829188 [Auriculariales sp. MPI-PUGE-AT-0066]